VLAVLAAGCTGDSSDDAEPPPGPEPAVEAWSLDLSSMVGPPVLAGDGVAVVQTVEDEDLDLVAVDTATGEELWRRTTTPGTEAPATPVRPRLIPQGGDDPVLVYARFGGEGEAGSASVTIVRPDLRTGEDEWVTEPLDVTSGPEPCADGSRGTLCVTTTDDSATYHRIVVDVGTGAAERVPPPAADVRRSMDGGELTDLRVNGDETIALLDDGRVVWTALVDDVIGPRVTAQFRGWWAHDIDAGLFVGTLGRFERVDQEVDLTTFRMVALDDATGAVAWTDDGSTPACVDRLAVPRARLAPATPAGPSLRCRPTGTAVFPRDVEGEVRFTDLGVVLEHFDPATGETDWELDLGARPSLPLRNRGVDLRGVGAVAGPRTSVLPVDGTPTLVDLVDGTTSAPDPDAVLACLTPAATFSHPDSWYADRGVAVPTERYGGHLVVPCGPDLEPVDAGLPPDVVAAVGLETGDVTLVALEDRLVGYRTP
jgi:hypothetical protein